jgi:outer membrane protein OmpA-like peptidoglycan-associated protein
MRSLLIAMLAAWSLLAQQPDAPAPAPEPDSNQVHQSDAVFKVDVVSRTVKVVNYLYRSGATRLDLTGTALMPQATGRAKVESKQGYIEIEVEFAGLESPRKFGDEYLTYVLWAITSDGRPVNLGELLLKNGRSKLNVTTKLQQFALLVTAEPYFAVSMPSDLVVLENEVRPDTRGIVDDLEAKLELLQRGQYSKYTDVARLSALRADPRTPIELLEARNALIIAESVQAPKYAPESYEKAREALNRAEDYLLRIKGSGPKPVAMMSREAVQRAEDARAIAVKRAEEERLAQERAAAAAREAAAREAAAREAEQRAAAEAARKAAEEARLAAENQRRLEEEARQRAEAERQRAEAERQRALLEAERAAREKAEAARLQAEEQARRLLAEKEAELAKLRAAEAEKQALAAQQAALEAQRLREEAERERQRLRQQLLQQLNIILETRDSARGLIVNMSDVLFDTGKFNLRPAAREKLARLSGILLAHPGLKLAVEGHTDSVGSDEFNQRLSENRAEAVRNYLISQGVPADHITAFGYGKEIPVASNATPEGRQRNRRVEIVVSGDIIGNALAAGSQAP